MYNVTVTVLGVRSGETVPAGHPLAGRQSYEGAAFLPEPGMCFTLLSDRDGDKGGFRTSQVVSIDGVTYKEDGKSLDTVQFRTRNTSYKLKIHNEVQ